MEDMEMPSGMSEIRAAVSSPEKAGVDGSTPSLATIIPMDLGRIPSLNASPLSVRIHEGHEIPSP